MPELAKHLIPAEFFAEYGGRLVAEERVQCLAETDLAKFNQGLRTDGGWFNDQQLFFAKGVPTFDDVLDYFYIDANDAEPRPVRYFHLTPADVGVCAASLDEFVQGRWNVVSNQRRH